MFSQSGYWINIYVNLKNLFKFRSIFLKYQWRNFANYIGNLNKYFKYSIIMLTYTMYHCLMNHLFEDILIFSRSSSDWDIRKLIEFTRTMWASISQLTCLLPDFTTYCPQPKKSVNVNVCWRILKGSSVHTFNK